MNLKHHNCVGMTNLHRLEKKKDSLNGEVFRCLKCGKVLRLNKSVKGELMLGQQKNHYKMFHADFLQPSNWKFYVEYENAK